MNFLFYYPAQYRGVDTEGNRLRFANCGVFAVLPEVPPVTLCGGLSQAGLPALNDLGSLGIDLTNLPGFMMLGGQRDGGEAQFVDPLRFGTPNMEAGGRPTSASADRCSAPPSVPAFTAELQFTAEGTVEQNVAMADAVLAGAAAALALSPTSAVVVVAFVEDLATGETYGPFEYQPAAAASRRLSTRGLQSPSGVSWRLTVGFSSDAEAAAAQTLLLESTATPSALAAFLAVPGLTPTSAGARPVSLNLLEAKAQPPPARIRTNGWIISGVGIALQLLCTTLIAWRWILRPPKHAAKPLAPAVFVDRSTAEGTSAVAAAPSTAQVCSTTVQPEPTASGERIQVQRFATSSPSAAATAVAPMGMSRELSALLAGFDEAVVTTLAGNDVFTIGDARLLSNEDLKELGFSVGVRNRLLHAIAAVTEAK